MWSSLGPVVLAFSCAHGVLAVVVQRRPHPSFEDTKYTRGRELRFPAVRDVFARQDNAGEVLGYVAGNSADPILCSADTTLGWYDGSNYIVCCAYTPDGSGNLEWDSCPAATSCIDYADNILNSTATEATNLNGTVLCPVNLQSCGTIYLTSADVISAPSTTTVYVPYSQYFCGTGSTTIQAYVTPFASQGVASTTTILPGTAITLSTQTVTSTSTQFSTVTSSTTNPGTTTQTTTPILVPVNPLSSNAGATSTSAVITTATAPGTTSAESTLESLTPPSNSNTVVSTSISSAVANLTPASASATPSPSPPSHPSHTGAIVGGVVGGVAAIALIAGIIYFLARRKQLARDAAMPEVSQYGSPAGL